VKGDATLIRGDCLAKLREIPAGSIDAVISDPPYPEIDRPYGRLTEAAWRELMHGVVAQCRRVLKPTGSAMFVLQPNSRKVGSMRPWLWEFMAWACREWNMVQDAWWWNHAAVPEAHGIQARLMRPSLKACVWLGPADCYRDQDAVLWTESQRNAARRLEARAARHEYPSGHGFETHRACSAAVRRGGVIPFNVLPITNTASFGSAGAHGHGAGTPEPLCDWWVRYISPPDGVVLDPFAGSGTVGLAALKRGRRFVGIEKHTPSFKIARRRVDAALASEVL
jgi:DNA modification methylase